MEPLKTRVLIRRSIYFSREFTGKKLCLVSTADELAQFGKFLAACGLAAEIEPIRDDGIISSRSMDVLILSSGAEKCELENPSLPALICDSHLRGVRVVSLEEVLLDLNPIVFTGVDRFIHTFSHFSVNRTFSRRLYTRAKYVVEPILAAFLLIALSPVVLFAAVLIKLTSEGPMIYSQERVGWRGVPFRIYKFRSMRIDAEKNGAVWASASKSDERLTSVGAFLRGSHIDELPQLWNVVLGQLSIVGPRPERPEFVQQLVKDIPLFELRTLVKPGITGWAQINQGYVNSISDSKRKLEFDLYYILKNSMWIDLTIVFGTVMTILRGGTEGRNRRMKNGFAPNGGGGMRGFFKKGGKTSPTRAA